MKVLTCIFVIFLNFEKLWAVFNSQPKIYTRDGNLVIEAGYDRNVSFNLSPRSYFNVNNVNLVALLDDLRNVSGTDSGGASLVQLSSDLTRLQNQIFRPNSGILDRIRLLEGNTTTRGRPGRGRNASTPDIDRLRRRVGALERRVNNLSQKLTADNCRSMPCQNGGTCIDRYNSFSCICAPGWQGPQCSQDVNECGQFAGTDLGCQNGATCINSPGSYSCVCAPNFFGTHCLRRTVDCATQSRELCDHGVCVHTNEQPGYKCICDQGWKSNGGPCNIDVDECAESRPHCSKEPEVQCINLPGSFMCGACPAGYSGNGFYCTDINECDVNNGGCSVNPKVRCVNLRGTYRCGRCPAGFQGDGKTCTPKPNGICGSGVCHPMATCTEYQNSIVNCVCPPGWTGSGYGATGCTKTNDTRDCPFGFCQNGGTCFINGTSYACNCPPGTAQPNCQRTVDPCYPNPCLNGGTCSVRHNGFFYCVCPRGYTGANCQTQRARCGGVLRTFNGTLKYPPTNSSYEHNTRCAWLIQTNSTKVLNVTFTSFDLERAVSSNCRFDWLQIHDGPSSSSQHLGRFCGSNLPLGGNFISSQNSLYLWFRSDNSTSHDGFELNWNTIDPVCGGSIEVTSHGVIASPGSPGNYPMNRDCYWRLSTSAGKRIQLTFFTLAIEAHTTCAYDYLAIYDGLNEESPLLEKFCNSTTPAPLMTPSNEVLLHFHSDAEDSDRGFQITYSTVPGTPGCGGTFTTSEGQFSSPLNYEDKTYPHNLECEYIIQQPDKIRIQLETLSFHLEDSSECRFDYIEIYEGRTTDDKLIGRFCGVNIPKTFQSEKNVLMIKFKSDWSTSHGGFAFKYRTICGGRFEETTGIITSPNYPSPYHGNTWCEYEIIAPTGNAIAIAFDDFELESNDGCIYDYLEIFDGVQTNTSSMGRYCGSNKPGEKVSSFNSLVMTFVTDSSIASRGFKANYSFVDAGCGGIIKRTDSTITSPKGENAEYYLSNQNCRWVIVAPDGYSIELEWQTFDLESAEKCQYDYVEIFDNSTGGVSLGKYCGSSIVSAMTISGNLATLVFVTDSSTAADGFSVKVNFLDSQTACGGNFFSSTGFIRSPGWPDNYLHSRNCTWKISVESGHQIELNFKNFSIEHDSNCRFDSLTVRNGGLLTSPVLGTFCGSEDYPKKLRSMSNQMSIQFISDASKNDIGFEIEWISTKTGCGGVLNSYRGTLTSPNFPEPYDSLSICSWRIAVNQGSKLQLIFNELDLEKNSDCGYDWVEVFDGKDTTAHSFGRHCDIDNHPLSITTTSNYAFIQFRSDISNQGKGFSLRYSSICNTTLTGFNGVIESPNFPGQYPPNLNCEWTIEGMRGNQIYVEFTHFDLESVWNRALITCNYDYVEVIQYKQNDTVNTKKYCESKPEPFTSVGSSVMIRFVTDSSTQVTGFRLEWSLEGCGGILKKPEGSLTSPGYPQAYKHGVECLWVIQANYGETIQLTVHELSIESSTGCKFDGLVIRSLDEDVAKMCHMDSNANVFLSHGHEMDVKFFTDDTVSFKGFNASYKVLKNKCGGQLTAGFSTIVSPNYPKIYDKSETCEWLIRIDPSHRVQFNLIDFDLEPSENCNKDVLVIYDGFEANPEKIMLRQCGNSLPNQTQYFSTANEMLVVFNTDTDGEYKGFKANYSTACGARIVTNSSGLIQLSDLAKLHNYNCTWTVIADDLAKHVTLTVTHLSMLFVPELGSECFFYVQIVDGEDLNGPERARECRGKAPPAIVSNGNAISLHIGQNSSINADTLFGLDLVAQYSVLDNACGGTLTSFQGIIASPKYPDSYPLNVECVWTVQASPGNIVTFTINNLDIQYSDACSDDYLEIREGGPSGKLYGVYCGTEPDRNVTTANAIWIKFKSGNDGTAKGFMAQYSYAYHSEIVASEGVVTNPLYPRSYVNEPQKVTYRITVPFGYVIAINFEELQIGNDQCADRIEFYDGFDSNSPKIGDGFCGFTLPKPFKSTSNVLYIETADLIVAVINALYKFSFKAVQPSKEAIVKTVEGCGYNDIVLSNLTQVINITSPGYPFGYANSLNCTWVISSVRPDFHPTIHLIDVDLDESDNCVGDYLKISTSNDVATWNELSRVCNSNFRTTLRPQMFEGTPNLKLEFISDFHGNRTGFNSLVGLSCGGVLTDPNGVISSGNVTTIVMRPSRTCIYQIKVRPGRQIKFEFDYLNLDKRDERCSSYMLIKNGLDETSPLLDNYGQICGTDPPTLNLTSGRYAYIKVVNNNLFVNTYHLRYSEVRPDCGGSFTLTDDFSYFVINSPNYPNIPNPHMECVWSFIAPAGEAMTITFINKFDMLGGICLKEYIELRDGGTSRAEELGTYCGYKNPPQTTTKSNMLRVKYFTDTDDPKSGFQANVTLAKCGGLYRSNAGYIKSPGFGRKGSYPPNTVCDYRIEAQTQAIVSLKFLSIDLPARSNCSTVDHVSIYSVVSNQEDQSNETLLLHGHYCGTDDIPEISGNSNEILIRFETFGAIGEHVGFRIKFNSTVSQCGGEINAESGEIVSPGYPVRMHITRSCDWRITVPKGRRVVANIVDLDIGGEGGVFYTNRITFYNGLVTYNRIRSVSNSNRTEVVKSSDNTMLIVLFVRQPSMNRGFKILFTSNETTICDGSLDNDSGTIYSPMNQSSFACEYIRTRSIDTVNTGTLVFEFKDVLAGQRFINKCQWVSSKIIVRWDSSPRKDENIMLAMCGPNILDSTVRTPFMGTVIDARQSLYGGNINFTLNYWVNKCGGIIRGSAIISNPTTKPSSTNSVGCAWYIYHDEGITFHIQIRKVNMKDTCDREYIQLYNGPTQSSPHLARICGNEKPAESITTQSGYLFIEYVAENYNSSSEFELSVVPSAAACGGIIHRPIMSISSPGNGTYYNNMECVWEIRADVGYGVNLRFTGRFYIESSVNCTKDYVEVFAQEDDEFVSKGRFCGRELPPSFNTTSNRMQVKLHTDDEITADGFTVEWSETCGGVFLVTDQLRTMISPGHPNNYYPNLNCNYTFHTKQKDAYLNLNFTSFALEETTRRCIYDNVTIYKRKEYYWGSDIWDKVGSFCRRDSPGHIRVKNAAVVYFQTDRYNEKTGFRIEYSLDRCGGQINESQTIESPMKAGTNETISNAKCIWKIYAPEYRIILIKIDYLILESTEQCWYDYLAAYSNDTTDSKNRKAKLCGKVNNTVVNLGSRVGALEFVTDSGDNYGGFRVQVIFSPDCSVYRTLDAGAPIYNLNVEQNQYLPNMDCHYEIKTQPGFVIKTTFNRFHVAPCVKNVSTSVDCSCDYLEIRDGGGPFADLIGIFCGHETPSSFTSSSSKLWIRFVTDGVNASAGFDIQFERTRSACGPPLLSLNNDGETILESPRGDGTTYLKNQRCQWIVSRNQTNYLGTFLITFDLLDLEDPDTDGVCSNDFLRITSDSTKDFVSEGLGEEVIFRGAGVYSQTASFSSGAHSPLAPHIYCGTGSPMPYYSRANKLIVTFQSNGDIEKRGFKMKVQTVAPCRNYTSLQGRIMDQNPKDCTFWIIAPQNYTITIFFQNAYFYENDCNKAGMKIFDGNAAQPSLKLCDYETANPFFSTFNSIRIFVKGTNSANGGGGSYDFSYVATDKGRGCGGQLFNYGGQFTSPLYPENARNDSDCRWDVSVPNNLKVALRFSVFDLGSKITCADNYVQIIEIDSQGREEVMRQYCGGDSPAVYRGSKNSLTVKFKKNVNFGGTGFIANYVAVHDDTKLYEW